MQSFLLHQANFFTTRVFTKWWQWWSPLTTWIKQSNAAGNTVTLGLKRLHPRPYRLRCTSEAASLKLFLSVGHMPFSKLTAMFPACKLDHQMRRTLGFGKAPGQICRRFCKMNPKNNALSLLFQCSMYGQCCRGEWRPISASLSPKARKEGGRGK